MQRDSGRLDPTPATWVPAPLSSLIGRERELGSIGHLFRHEGKRLVTLTGPGGVGKTRLAQAVAAALEPAFHDGVVFLPLETVRHPDQFLPTLAGALGVGEGSGTGAGLTRVLGRMRDLHLLLLLDNFEQIVEAGSVLAAVLEACPGVSALVTSRRVLHVSGEYDVALLPLDVPAPDAPDLRASPSVRMFLDRAASGSSRWSATDADLPVVTEICARLDGLPLAIELAAARITVFTPDELGARLEQRLPLLVGGAQDRPERLQTMRNAIAWSADLLNPTDQALFRRLSVFVGGWTLDAALALCEDMGATTVVDALGRLVDSSLVRTRELGGVRRFSMLETIREFGVEMLEASGDAYEMSTRHVRVMTGLAERYATELMQGRIDPSLLQAANTEMPNVLAALDWCERNGRSGERLRLATAIAPFWLFEGRLGEGTRILEDALAHYPDAPPGLRAQALRHLGMLYRPAGDDDRAVARLRESLALQRNDGDPLEVATTLNFLAIVLLGRGDYDEAEEAWKGAMERFRAVPEGDVWIDHVVHHQGLLRYGQGRVEEAIALLHRARDRYRHHGDPRGEASALVALALIDAGTDNPARAGSRLLEALDVWESLGMSEGLAGCFATTVVLAHAVERYPDAARLYGMTKRICEADGIAFSLPERETYDATYDDLRSRLSDDAWRRAFSEGRERSTSEAIVDVRRFLGEVGQEPTPADAFGLSPREVEVLALLTSGATDREIAEDLYVSVRTAQAHVSHILRKLDVRSRSEASAVAVRHDLV